MGFVLMYIKLQQMLDSNKEMPEISKGIFSDQENYANPPGARDEDERKEMMAGGADHPAHLSDNALQRELDKARLSSGGALAGPGRRMELGNMCNINWNKASKSAWYFYSRALRHVKHYQKWINTFRKLFGEHHHDHVAFEPNLRYGYEWINADLKSKLHYWELAMEKEKWYYTGVKKKYQYQETLAKRWCNVDTPTNGECSYNECCSSGYCELRGNVISPGNVFLVGLCRPPPVRERGKAPKTKK